MTRELWVVSAGTLPYGEALALQREIAAARIEGTIPHDVLLLVEHPPVVTRGRTVKSQHMLCTPAFLAARGVEFHEVERGGDVTFHGPGQLVGYPIIDLKPDRCDVHAYVRDLEEVMIRVAAAFGVEASRIPGLTGAWVGNEKLAAIGVRIARWVTSHGFAFNVNTELDHFHFIVPCGITGKGVTSLQKLLGRPVAMAEVEDSAVDAFTQVFN